MPRVSAAHLEARRGQILGAARACFARNGFHSTTMQDVVREAGLSVGAVYRYFPSKNELIRAIAEGAIGQVTARLDAVVVERPLPPLSALYRSILDLVDLEAGPDGALRMAVQVWGEALRDPDLAAHVSQVYRQVRDRFVALAERAQAEGTIGGQASPAQVGAVMFGMVHGYLLQRILIGDVDRDSYSAGIAALVREVSGPGTSPGTAP
ncbi:TetR/AcrR family transcriptional regulator [Longispora sp. K20-0274]|uniref:TetR/AcrR family transcriptional regulator n=1 Tax=Longispora sp. K20-0274 TaxID=3088255 RepID=UPI00399A9122